FGGFRRGGLRLQAQRAAGGLLVIAHCFAPTMLLERRLCRCCRRVRKWGQRTFPPHLSRLLRCLRRKCSLTPFPPTPFPFRCRPGPPDRTAAAAPVRRCRAVR